MLKFDTIGAAGDFADGSTVVQTYETAQQIKGRNAYLWTASQYNHTKDGSRSVQLISIGYQPNKTISQVLITDADDIYFIPENGVDYIFKAYLYSDKADTVRFKLLDTDESLAYTDTSNILYEIKGLELPAKQWVEISCRFTVNATLGRVGAAVTPNDETSKAGATYYIDDVSVVRCDTLSAALNASAEAELCTSENEKATGISIPYKRAIYFKNGIEYSAMLLFGEYFCTDGDYTKFCVGGVNHTIKSRGFVLANPETANADTAVQGGDGVLTIETSGEALRKCYSEENGRVKYSILLKDISVDNADVCYAVRPFVTLSFTDSEYTLYGDIEKGADGKGLSVQKAFSARGDSSLVWYSSKNAGVALSEPFNTKFSVVYPENADFETIKCALDLKSEIQQTLCGEVPAYSDAAADSGGYEILVGKTNRTLSDQAYADLGNTSYVLRYSDKKIAIAGENEYSLKNAVEEFKASFCNDSCKTVPQALNVSFSGYGNELKASGKSIKDFSLRTEKYPSSIVMLSAKELQRFVLNQTGVLISLSKTESDSEIFIKVDETLPYNYYRLTLSGTKLTVSGGSADAVSAGVSEFQAQLLSQGNLTSGFEGSFADGGTLDDNYALAWSDEFNGDALDTSKWSGMTDTTAGPYYKTSEPYYTASAANGIWITGRYVVSDLKVDGVEGNVSEQGGYVFYDNISTDALQSSLITAVKSSGGNVILSGTVPGGYAMEGIQSRPSEEGVNYSVKNGVLAETTSFCASGYEAVRITSANHMNYRYGFTEARMKMAANNGACSALWLTLNQGEIDVYENYGKDSFYSNLHSWLPGKHTDFIESGDMKKIIVSPASGEHFYDTYHHIGFEWTDSYIAFYLDGTIFNLVDITDAKFDVFRDWNALRLANGVGTQGYSVGSNPGNYVSMGAFKETQEIDFIRVYQKHDKISGIILKN